MYQVVWLESAANEVAGFWIDADSPLRAMITAAVAEIDRRLTRDASNVGESRDHLRRIDFAYPLAVTYQVDLDAKVATVLHVRVYRRRQ